ncbi:MAG: DUF3192 domain-containing protein [Wenzhouxiangellaceae bacterium]
MHVLMRLIPLILIAPLLTGCVVAIGNDDFGEGSKNWSRVERENRAAIDGLRLGMGIYEVQDAMPNEPEFNEAFSVAGVSHRVLFYRTQRVDGDGVTTRDETTPLVFTDGRLTGWGESAWRNLTGRPLAERAPRD